MKQKHPALGYAAALGSAALVGLFTVLNKWLLSEALPPLTAGAWTYLAAGIALLPWANHARGLRFNRPWLMAAWLLAGSVAGPSLYFLGLELTSGVQGVLMINMEAVFTALLAFVIFHEKLTPKTAAAGIAIIAGGIVMSWPQNRAAILTGNTLGNLLIAAGYVAWGAENNLGRLLGENIPAVTLVCLKAIVAAIVMGLLAPIFGQSLVVRWQLLPGIAASGAVALSCSLALFYLAMQHIGSARTGLVASSSILWGIVAALIILQERLTLLTVFGGALMILGIFGLGWDSLDFMPKEPETSPP